jgi:hypothetical protein
MAAKQEALHPAGARGEPTGEPATVPAAINRHAVVRGTLGAGRREHAWLPSRGMVNKVTKPCKL